MDRIYLFIQRGWALTVRKSKIQGVSYSATIHFGVNSYTQRALSAPEAIEKLDRMLARVSVDGT